MTQPLDRTKHTLVLLTGALLLSLLWAAAAEAAILELTGPAGATVHVNGRPRGEFPLEHPLDLGPGDHLVECSLPGHKDYRWVVHLADESDWQRLQVRLTPLSRKTAVLSNIVLAGLGQHYMEDHTRGWIYNLAEAGGLLTALVGEAGRVNERKDYLVLKEKYDTALNPEDIAYFKDKSNQAYRNMQDKEDLRNMGLAVAGGAVLLSMLDSLILFPHFEAGPGSGIVHPRDLDHAGLDHHTGIENFTTVHAGVKLAF